MAPRPAPDGPHPPHPAASQGDPHAHPGQLPAHRPGSRPAYPASATPQPQPVAVGILPAPPAPPGVPDADSGAGRDRPRGGRRRGGLGGPGGAMLAVKTLPQVVDSATKWVVGILGAVATFFLTLGGARYLMAGGDPGEVEKAKEAFSPPARATPWRCWPRSSCRSSRDLGRMNARSPHAPPGGLDQDPTPRVDGSRRAGPGNERPDGRRCPGGHRGTGSLAGADSHPGPAPSPTSTPQPSPSPGPPVSIGRLPSRPRAAG